MDIKDRVGPSLINFSTNFLKNVETENYECWGQLYSIQL